MALPKLETPQHSCKLPILEKQIFFRPFLVGEQKALLIAQESENQNEQINEMMRLINLCAEDIIAEDLTTVDLEYLFLQIRIKSVGETSEVLLSCAHCEADNEQIINLEKSEVFTEKEVSNIVSLTPTITMELTLPSYKMIQTIEFQTGEEGELEDMKASDAFEVIQQCVVSIIDGDEVHSREDFTKSESSLCCFLRILPAVSGPTPLPAMTIAALAPSDLAKEADLSTFFLLTSRSISMGCNIATIRLLHFGHTSSCLVIPLTFLFLELSQDRHLSERLVRRSLLRTAVTTELSDLGGFR